MAVNTLFTSAGRRVELLRAFRRAYQSLKLPGRIIAVDIDPLAPAIHEADRSYIAPRVDTPAYLLTLAEICRHEEINLVFPLIDHDIPVLARGRDLLEATGAHVAVVPLEAAEIVSDKWRTLQFFTSLQLAAPSSFLPADGLPSNVGYPLFIKPRRGSAGKDAYKIRNEAELRFFSAYIPHAMVQEFVDGPEITNDVVCDLEGELLAVVSRQRIEVRSGEVAKGVTIFDEGIADACARIARALPAVGPITVQCLVRDGVALFTEINARMGGGLPLAMAAGVDVPRLLLGKAAGLSPTAMPPGAYTTGLYMTRFDDSYFVTQAEHEKLAGHGL